MSRRCRQPRTHASCSESPRSVRFASNDWRQGMGLMVASLWLAIHVANDLESVTGDSEH
jgi:hypothetical protein